MIILFAKNIRHKKISFESFQFFWKHTFNKNILLYYILKFFKGYINPLYPDFILNEKI